MKNKEKEEIVKRIVEIESDLEKKYDLSLINEIQELVKNLDFKDLMELDEEITRRMGKCD